MPASPDINEPRGDQITVETLPFENTLAAEPPSPNAPPAKSSPAWSLKQPLVLGGAIAFILVIVLIAGVVFLLMRSRPPAATATDTAPVAIPGSDPAAIAVQTAQERMEKLISSQQAQQAELEAEALSRIKLPANTKQTEVLVRHIRDSVQKDPVSSTNVPRTWISDLDTKRTS